MHARSCREARRINNQFVNLSTTERHYHHYHYHRYRSEELGDSVMEAKTEDESCWVPHPRTGIYMPKGHEWVMDDVPEGAASFNQTYWLRNVDGVERPDPDVPSDHYLAKDFY